MQTVVSFGTDSSYKRNENLDFSYQMAVLVTGSAGFIGFHVTSALLHRGERVIGIDNLNPYYSVTLKRARLAELSRHRHFEFQRLDLSKRGAFDGFLKSKRNVDRVIHLAAQAGVRYSMEQPRAYVAANLIGHVEVLEGCRNLKRLKHLVFASSSSVYSGNTKLPFSETDRVERPQSLYAATKRSDELMSFAYAQLYGIPTTGLRFFTVYGPWGRPDMAAWLFTEAILAGKPIKLFNGGRMRRDFTYIDDVVAGVVASLDRPPTPASAPPFRLYNLGNNRSEKLLRFVSILEAALGKKAKRIILPMQPGDARATYADITAAARDLGFRPQTSIDEGLEHFVAWYQNFYARKRGMRRDHAIIKM